MILDVSAQLVDDIEPTIAVFKAPTHGSFSHRQISICKYLE
jgi:hypothetical protein